MMFSIQLWNLKPCTKVRRVFSGNLVLKNIKINGTYMYELAHGTKPPIMHTYSGVHQGRLLGQAMILSSFNCVPFLNGNFSLWKEFAPRGSEFFPLRAVPYGLENHFYHIR